MAGRHSQQAPPPDDLAGFPTRRWFAGRDFFRAAGKNADGSWRTPWWFCTCGDCRFDLAPSSGLGTLYAATNAVAALIEYLGFETSALVSMEMFARRRVCRLRYDVGFPLASTADPRAAAFGITAELTSMPEYEMPQQWAQALVTADYEGIWYHARFAVNATPASLAMFDAVGAHERWPVVDSVPAQSGEFIAHLSALGVAVARAPRLADLTVIK